MPKGLPQSAQSALDKLEPAMREAFLSAIAEIKNAVQLRIVMDHIAAGRIDQAIVALRLEDAFFDPVARLIGEAFVQGGRTALGDMPAIPDPFPVERDSRSRSTVDVRAPSNGWGEKLES